MRRESDTLRIGSAAPDFTLNDVEGRTHTLRDLLARGPLLLVFDRGTW
jgi:peroxiredoxin